MSSTSEKLSYLRMAATLGVNHAFEHAGLTKRGAVATKLKTLLPAAIAGGVVAPSVLTATLAPKGEKWKSTGIAGLSGLAGILGGVGGHALSKKLLPKINPIIGALLGGSATTGLTALGLRGKIVKKKTVDLTQYVAVRQALAIARARAAKNRQLLTQLIPAQETAAVSAAKSQANIARMLNPA